MGGSGGENKHGQFEIENDAKDLNAQNKLWMGPKQ